MQTQVLNLVASGGPLTVRPFHYASLLGRSLNVNENINTLCNFYRQRMKDDPDNLESSMQSFWNQVVNRDMDPFETLADLISMVSNKRDDEKKCIRYFVGCLRGRLNEGPNATGNDIDTQLIPVIENRIKKNLSPMGRSRLITLVTKYGPVKISSALLSNEFNAEAFFLLWLEDLLQTRSEE